MSTKTTQNALKTTRSQNSSVSLPPPNKGQGAAVGFRPSCKGIKPTTAGEPRDNVECDRTPVGRSQYVATNLPAKFASESKTKRADAHRRCVPTAENQSGVAAAHSDSRIRTSEEKKSRCESTVSRRSRLIKVIALTSGDVTYGGLHDDSNHKGSPPKIQYLRVIPISSDNVDRSTLPRKPASMVTNGPGATTAAARRPQTGAVCDYKVMNPVSRGGIGHNVTATPASNEFSGGKRCTTLRYSAPSTSQIFVAEWLVKMGSWIRGGQSEHSRQEVAAFCPRQAYWGIAPCGGQGSTSSTP
ncbi:hypothetical protein SprV_0501804100 [Sparganum proliferum]